MFIDKIIFISRKRNKGDNQMTENHNGSSKPFDKCPYCGSANIEVRNGLSGQGGGLVRNLMQKLAGRTIRQGPLAGSFRIICKDCGKESLIQS